MRIARILLSGAILIAAIAAFNADTYAVPEGKLRVGIIFPFTGEASGFGEAGKNGFELGFKKLPPEIQEKIEVIYEDDGLEPRKSHIRF